jgi:hypothetical protein
MMYFNNVLREDPTLELDKMIEQAILNKYSKIVNVDDFLVQKLIHWDWINNDSAMQYVLTKMLHDHKRISGQYQFAELVEIEKANLKAVSEQRKKEKQASKDKTKASGKPKKKPKKNKKDTKKKTEHDTENKKQEKKKKEKKKQPKEDEKETFKKGMESKFKVLLRGLAGDTEAETVSDPAEVSNERMCDSLLYAVQNYKKLCEYVMRPENKSLETLQHQSFGLDNSLFVWKRLPCKYNSVQCWPPKRPLAFIAAKYNSIEVLKVLVDTYNVKLLHRDKEHGHTILHEAAMWCQKEAVEWIISRLTNPNTKLLNSVLKTIEQAEHAWNEMYSEISKDIDKYKKYNHGSCTYLDMYLKGEDPVSNWNHIRGLIGQKAQK